MFPVPSSSNVANRRFADSESAGEFGIALIRIQDFKSLQLGQACSVVRLTDQMFSPTFFDTVFDVVRTGADEQVVPINTRRVVASVADLHAVRYHYSDEQKREVRCRTRDFAAPKKPVTFLVAVSSPN